MISLPILPHDSIRRVRLPNGLTVLLRRDDSAPVVAIVTYVKAGYFDETDDVVGVAHVLEHMYFKGTERRGVGEISKETKAAGGYLNAGTIYDHTSYYTVLPASGFARGLEIQADAYANSVIDAEELRKELEVIIQEAKRKADNPGAVTVETLYEVLHDRHRMRRWRIGREEGLRRLGRGDVVGFYRTYYRPHNTILSIVGDIDPDEALRQVERLYGGLADEPFRRDRGPQEDEKPGFRYRELAGDVSQAQLAFGWRTPPSMHGDTPLLDLAATVLGSGRASRLYRAVRERKLAAAVAAYDYTPTDLGVFVVHAEGQPDTLADAARNVWEQMRELRDAGVGRDELWRARRIFEARWIRRLETAEGQASYLAEWEAEGDWALGDRYLERLLTATAEQVAEAMRIHLSPDQASVVVYRPEGAPPVARDATDFRHLLERERPAPLPVPPPRAATVPAVHTGAPPLERAEGRVRVYRTERGVPILVRRKGGAPLVHLGLFALGGASDEPAAAAGLTHLMARTAIKGTERRTATQIAEDAELLGGSIVPHTGAESFGWTISVPAAHADAALELLSDVTQWATLSADALETERTIARADLQLLRDDMYRYPMRLLTSAAFAGHPYGVPASGTEESLAAIDAEALRAWHRARVLAGPVVLAVVGEVDPDLVAARVARCFSQLEMGDAAPLAPPAWPARPTAAVESREKAQTALALAFPAPAREDDDRFAAHLIAGVASGLGGRFFEELRDRQSLAYTVQAFSAERRAAGLFVSYIATSPDKEEIARDGLLREFAKLREAPVGEEELARAKEYAIGSYAIHQASGGAVLGDVVDAWLFGRSLAELDAHDAMVRAVTPERMQSLARRYFDESRLVQGIVRGRQG
ncbi:MAG TPA: pitrilysin family protein [Gemmatimonadaceae bacterium]|nr:pitrilysin family protein [Gemmatimonadaceae bacterium]